MLFAQAQSDRLRKCKETEDERKRGGHSSRGMCRPPSTNSFHQRGPPGVSESFVSHNVKKDTRALSLSLGEKKREKRSCDVILQAGAVAGGRQAARVQPQVLPGVSRARGARQAPAAARPSARRGTGATAGTATAGCLEQGCCLGQSGSAAAASTRGAARALAHRLHRHDRVARGQSTHCGAGLRTAVAPLAHRRRRSVGDESAAHPQNHLSQAQPPAADVRLAEFGSLSLSLSPLEMDIHPSREPEETYFLLKNPAGRSRRARDAWSRRAGATSSGYARRAWVAGRSPQTRCRSSQNR